MKKCKNFTVVIISLLAIFQISCNLFLHKSISIYRFNPDAPSGKVESAFFKGKKYFNLNETFIVKNYKENKQTEIEINEFILKNRPKDWKLLNTYDMNFYKETPFTNEEYLSQNLREFYRYSIQHDILYFYRWNFGKLVYRWKYKDGEVINNSDSLKPGDFHFEIISDSLKK